MNLLQIVKYLLYLHHVFITSTMRALKKHKYIYKFAHKSRFFFLRIYLNKIKVSTLTTKYLYTYSIYNVQIAKRSQISNHNNNNNLYYIL